MIIFNNKLIRINFVTQTDNFLNINVILMNIKKTIFNIKHGKFSFIINFWILFGIGNLVVTGIGIIWLEFSNFLMIEKILFPFYFIIGVYFSIITALGAWRSGNNYVYKNKEATFMKYLSILIKVIIIFWSIRIFNTFLLFIFLFKDKV